MAQVVEPNNLKTLSSAPSITPKRVKMTKFAASLSYVYFSLK
jgi:hypothetical protein